MIKRQRCRLLLTGILASGIFSVSTHAQCAALEESIHTLFCQAERSNATLRTLSDAVSESQAGVATAKGEWLPEITGQASVAYLGDARLWNRHFGESTAAPMPHFGNNFALRAQQTVYSGGAITNGIRMARQQQQMAELNADKARLDVRLLIVGLYMQLHSLGNSQTVYDTNARLASRLIEQMRKRHEQGVALRNDITRYELQLQQLLLGSSTMADRRNIVEHQLLTALGAADGAFSLRILPDSCLAAILLPEADEEEWHRRAMQHVSLQKADLAFSMSRTQERLERSAMIPKIAVVAEDHLDGPITVEVPPVNKNLNYWYVGLGVSYNFSSLYKNRRKLRQAEASTVVAKDRQTLTMEHVDDAVHEASVCLGTARTELATHQKSVQLATENYEVVARRYENGLAIITDLTDAANMKLSAELALANARIELLYAYFKLKYAAGEL